MRVCGECCGLWRRGFGAVKEKVLSLGANSLWKSVPRIWVEVREWFFINSLKSVCYLLTNQASFCVALGSKRDHHPQSDSSNSSDHSGSHQCHHVSVVSIVGLMTPEVP